MKHLQEAEELQRHGDHEQPGNYRESALGGVQRAAEQHERGSLPGTHDLPQRARQRAQKAIGGQSSGVIEQMAYRRRHTPTRIAAEPAGKATAHADAMKAAGKTSGENNQVVSHAGSPSLIRRLPSAEKSATATVSRGKRPRQRTRW